MKENVGSTIDPIDDYIGPQLILKAKAKEIEKLTLRKDWNNAYIALIELKDACKVLDEWLLSRIEWKIND